MPLFENENWTVVPQIVERVYRNEDRSLVGFLIEGRTQDGGAFEIVTDHGIAASPRDLGIATLFAASNDLFNAAEKVLPILRALYLGDEEFEAVAHLQAALLKAVTAGPGHGRIHDGAEASGARP